MTDDRVPTSIVEKIMDRADKETAKELSNVETIVATLVTQLNTPPRIEDVNRLSIDIKTAIDSEVVRRLGTIESDFSGLSERIDKFIARIKWVAGVVVIAVGIAVSVISYVTTITEKTIDAHTAIQIKQIEEKYEAESERRSDEFKKLIQEIQNLRNTSSQ